MRRNPPGGRNCRTARSPSCPHDSHPYRQPSRPARKRRAAQTLMRGQKKEARRRRAAQALMRGQKKEAREAAGGRARETGGGGGDPGRPSCGRIIERRRTRGDRRRRRKEVESYRSINVLEYNQKYTSGGENHPGDRTHRTARSNSFTLDTYPSRLPSRPLGGSGQCLSRSIDTAILQRLISLIDRLYLVQ